MHNLSYYEYGVNNLKLARNPSKANSIFQKQKNVIVSKVVASPQLFFFFFFLTDFDITECHLSFQVSRTVCWCSVYY